eukprot:1994943-Rhodomonas_salina.1
MSWLGGIRAQSVPRPATRPSEYRTLPPRSPLPPSLHTSLPRSHFPRSPLNSPPSCPRQSWPRTCGPGQRPSRSSPPSSLQRKRGRGRGGEGERERRCRKR